MAEKKHTVKDKVLWRGREFKAGDKIEFVEDTNDKWRNEYNILPKSAQKEMKPFLK